MPADASASWINVASFALASRWRMRWRTSTASELVLIIISDDWASAFQPDLRPAPRLPPASSAASPHQDSLGRSESSALSVVNRIGFPKNSLGHASPAQPFQKGRGAQ